MVAHRSTAWWSSSAAGCLVGCRQLRSEALTPRHEPVPGGLTLGEHALAGGLAGAADQHRRLRAEAMTDRVSGAWNRRYFDRFPSAAIEQARANRQMLTVLVFDLDNFKQFNDEFGHETGDMIRETVSLMHR